MHFDQIRLPPGPDRYGRLRVQREDLAPARWLETENMAAFATVAAVCAPGFPAYARILHPAQLGAAPVAWSEAAAAYGRTVSGTTTWPELIGSSDPFGFDHDGAGRPGVWDEHPTEGPTPPDVARVLAPVLARHTTAPDRCWYGLWEGYGQYDWGHVPTFATPGRDEVLLAGPLADVTSPMEGPEASTDDHFFIEVPDLWWPEDRAWCVGGDVDLLSTYVGGSRACVEEILATPGLEAHPVTETSRVG